MDVLRTRFGGEIVTKDDAGYEDAIVRWARNAIRPAAVVVFPKTNADVAHALAYARETKTSIAVRGGGHSSGGASSVSDGLVIDLSRHFNGVRVDAEAKVAFVGGGAQWKTVDEECIKHNLATVGGTVNHTGVGGLVLGGGYGWLCGQHGLAIDNLVEATVVTAAGDVVKASESSNQDLFFGLRGGGGNFGVVTEFVLRLHPQARHVYAGLMIFPAVPGMCESIADLLSTWWDGITEREGINMFIARSPEGHPAFVLGAFYNGTEEEGRARFRPFLEHKPMVHNTMAMIPYETLNTLTNHIAPYGELNFYLKGLSVTVPEFLRSPAFADLHQVHMDGTEGLFKRSAIVLELYPLKTIANGDPDGKCAFRRKGLKPNMAFVLCWEPEPGADVRAQEMQAREFGRKLEAVVDRAEPVDVFYANFDDDLADKTVEKSHIIFGDSYRRLQEVKAKYDPESMFSRWFPITPAV